MPPTQRRLFSFKCHVKQAPDDDDESQGFFEGLLAVYNTVDLGGDSILPGAMARSIQNRKGQLPLLWQHQPDKPIGTLSLEDSPNALKVKGRLLLGLPLAQEAYQLLQAGVIKGLSIGYDTIVESFENNVRVLKEIRLWEGSVVTFPMNEAAMVTAIKSVDDGAEREIVAMLKKMTSKAEQAAGSASTLRTVRRGR